MRRSAVRPTTKNEMKYNKNRIYLANVSIKEQILQKKKQNIYDESVAGHGWEANVKKQSRNRMNERERITPVLTVYLRSNFVETFWCA